MCHHFVIASSFSLCLHVYHVCVCVCVCVCFLAVYEMSALRSAMSFVFWRVSFAFFCNECFAHLHVFEYLRESV